MKFILVVVAMFAFAGCGTITPVANNYEDLSVCGDFPVATGDGGPTSHYFVCRNANDGGCYYKKTSFEQIPGCDPEFDKYDYGKEECFSNKTATYTLEGNLLETTENVNDKCSATTQTYFESKVSE